MQPDIVAEISVDTAWLARRCREGGLRSVERTLAGLIRAGELPRGTRLPTVRDTARLLELSPGTIAAIWKRLREDGLIDTNRRGGTIVVASRAAAASPGDHIDDWMSFDLAHGGPDPKLQPDLEAAMLAGLKARTAPIPQRETITAALVDAVAPTWPFKPEAWSTAGGGTEGIYLALEAAAAGGTVAIEEPTNPRLVEAVRALGLKAIGVAWDEEGPAIASLQKALLERPAAFVYQPRAHFPLGRAVSAARIGQMAECLRPHRDVVIVEDDGLGPLSSAPASSLGAFFPNRTLHVRTYCKAYGVDLKVCVVAGARALVQRFNQGRSHGTGMTSRILQGALHHLIASASVDRTLRTARRRYAARRAILIEALRAHGLTAEEGEGIALWIAVPDEATALINLSARGIAAGPGRHCFAGPPKTSHLWLTTSRLPENEKIIGELASIIADSVGDAGVRGYD